ncbi:YceI family protein [uncultured Aquimarina sp.]|uniref:YceI family protein n=1 Tax=uncultured Aquimarina sp. TaxID=575652 RepID=UPI002602BB70|nr:YceI family protein [uncultured Aquimarina sp.]
MKTNVRIQLNKLNVNIVKIYISMLILMVFFGCSNKTDFISTESGLQYKIIKPGSGPAVVKGKEVLIHETTTYTDDSLVYTSRNSPSPLKILVGGNQVIKGVDEGLQGMKIGEVRKLIVPPSLSKRTGNVTFPHPDSTLLYEIELIDIVKEKIPTKAVDGNILKINKDKSILRWEGFNKLQTEGHYGTVTFDSGAFYMKENRIFGGEFVIDMNTIINTDGDYIEFLVDHLKNADFFETDKYPVASLKIITVKYIDDSNISVLANLIIKDVQQPIEFNAHIAYKEKKLIFTSKFTIDRTLWNIVYASGSVFGSLGDNLISDEIQFETSIFTE